MKKSAIRIIFGAIFALILILSASVGAFAEQACEHTNTVARPDADGLHFIVCTECNETLYTASCYGGDRTCSARPVCVLCGMEYGAPPLPHIKGDGLSYNDECHFIACVNCDGPYPGTEEEHYFTNWYTKVSATETTEGMRERECFDCGYIQSAPVSAVSPKESGTITLIIVLLSVALLAAATFVLYKRGVLKSAFAKLKK